LVMRWTSCVALVVIAGVALGWVVHRIVCSMEVSDVALGFTRQG